MAKKQLIVACIVLLNVLGRALSEDLQLSTEPTATEDGHLHEGVSMHMGDTDVNAEGIELCWKCNIHSQGPATRKAVSFKATRTTHVTLLGGDDTLVFDNVLEDTHDAYDSTTGVFTAPRSGRYLVSSTVLSQPGEYVPACVRKNGNLVMTFHTGESRQWNSGSLTLVEYMDKGDRLEIRTVVGQSGYVWGHAWTTFSAFWLSD